MAKVVEVDIYKPETLHKCASSGMWKPKNFDEACKRAAGRRAYNRQRRLARADRIEDILVIQDRFPHVTGRELAAYFKVHEATISRDLKFIKKVKEDYRQSMKVEMSAKSFRWVEDARGYEVSFEMVHGRRLR
jgi:hypothetical protein